MRLSLFPRWILIGILIGGALASAHAQSTLIPSTTRRDMVFDHTGNYLYITTSDGFVQRYNLTTKQIDNSYNLGGSLNAIDIAPDDSFILAAQNNLSGTTATVHKVNLANGAISNITYTVESGELGPWDLVIGANGRAFVSTQGSLPLYEAGWTPLRQIDLGTGAVTIKATVDNGFNQGNLRHNTQLFRSADYSRFYLVEPNAEVAGPVLTYTVATDSFSQWIQASFDMDKFEAGVSRDGSLLATPLPYFGWVAVDTGSDFSYVRTLNEPDGGLAFDGARDFLYYVQSSTDQIVAYDTTNFAEQYRLTIGENLSSGITQFGSGVLVASPNGNYLALATPAGIRLFNVATSPSPSPTPTPSLGTPRGMVFDHADRYFYIATAQGFIARYDLTNGALDNPYKVGGILSGMDISSDDSYLLVAQTAFGLWQGAFQKVEIATGKVTNINFPRAREDTTEAGAWDVAIASNGFALGTTMFVGSGWTPLHEINLATNELFDRKDVPPSDSTVKGLIRGHGALYRSADHSRIAIANRDGTNGTVFSYSAATDNFGPAFNAKTWLDQAGMAVNRDGSLFGITQYSATATGSLLALPDFTDTHDFGGLDSGVVFDPVQDVLYAINSSTDEIVAYDTNTYQEKFRFLIGEDVDVSTGQFARGTMVISPSGHYLALLTEKTLWMYDISHGPPPPPNYAVSLSSDPAGAGTLTGAGPHPYRSNVTVTAAPNAGYNFSNWSEGVSFVSANASYTFTLQGGRALIAHFVPQPTLSLSPATATVRKNQSVTITVVGTNYNPYQPLTVNYSLSGNAVLGTDYVVDGTPNQIVIPNNQNYGTLVLTAISPKKKGSEKVTITLTPGTGYKIAGATKKVKKPAQATVTIQNK